MHRRTAAKKLAIVYGGLITLPFWMTACDISDNPIYLSAFSPAEQDILAKITDTISVARTLDTVKMLGFTEIEGGGNRTTPEEFRKLCDQRGISITSTGAGYDELARAPDSVAYRATKSSGSNIIISKTRAIM